MHRISHALFVKPLLSRQLTHSSLERTPHRPLHHLSLSVPLYPLLLPNRSPPQRRFVIHCLRMTTKKIPLLHRSLFLFVHPPHPPHTLHHLLLKPSQTQRLKLCSMRSPHLIFLLSVLFVVLRTLLCLYPHSTPRFTFPHLRLHLSQQNRVQSNNSPRQQSK